MLPTLPIYLFQALMYWITAINHLFNFIAPALWMALVLAVGGAWVCRGQVARLSAWHRFMLDSAAGVAVLLLGLVLGGRDGKMLTYLALVLVCSTCDWWARGGDRRVG